MTLDDYAGIMMYYYHQSFRDIHDMDFDDILIQIGNIPRLNRLFTGEPSGGGIPQKKPGDMMTPDELLKMVDQMAETPEQFDPNSEVMKDGIKYTIRNRR